MKTNLASHGKNIPFEDLIKRLEGEPPSCGTKKAVEIVEQLMQFDLGRFLIANRGLNGIWTSYIVLHPDKGRITGLNNQGEPFSDLESWLLNKCPGFLATQERFRIFQQITKQHLRLQMQLASIPCGLMDDLLSLDYSELSGIEITGIDLDDASLKAAANNYAARKPVVSAHFEQKDAWTLNSPERWDFMTSNGLNIYVDDDQKVIRLYRHFFESLKPGGRLLTSFVTPPPISNPEASWKVFDETDLKLQALLFYEILQVTWQCFRTEEQTRAQLEKAGFEVETVCYDKQRIFPSVLATKKA